MLKTGEVARILQISGTTVRKYADEGLLPCRILPSGVRLFSEDDVELFYNSLERGGSNYVRKENL